MGPPMSSSAALDASSPRQKRERRGPPPTSSSKQPSKEAPKGTSSGGLAGVVAGESSICTVALGSGLNYRGYNVVDLAREATFEEVVHLLLLGELPNHQQLAILKQKLYRARQLPPQLLTVLKQIPKEAHPMIAIRLIGGFPVALNYWYHFADSGKEISLASDPADSLATNFLKLMNGNPDFKPHPIVAKTLDTSLILYAEHDFNASTFACRVTAGTRSDMYSCICSGIGTLKGPLHGGANQAALEMLLPLTSIDKAKQRLEEAFARRELVMGFGHRMYKDGDPRAPLMRQLAEALAGARLPHSDPELVRIGAFIEEHMLKRKNMHPNVDFSAAIAYKQCGVPIRFFTPLFAIARTAGWAAHVLEQRAVNKLIRPTSIYKGPKPRPFVPMDRRSPSANL
ncbi:Citrate synthase, related [Eimeria mitis]|uniref:Citrate synthase n=1 Tax=Eimeria mitis TaxID=44415 RepID=U6K763_9EIME|nr:Citrate synthase, related [Eimeria mitis]CDJ33809.1 Citrate synthase, related [Eimeria mitis]